jgi:hypothetical protein
MLPITMHHFCPTNENVPFANHRSFASFTRWAAARFVSSNPCTGVTTSDDAVPDVCAEFAARASAVVRSRFAFDIFAAYQRPTRQQIKSKNGPDKFTYPDFLTRPRWHGLSPCSRRSCRDPLSRQRHLLLPLPRRTPYDLSVFGAPFARMPPWLCGR